MAILAGGLPDDANAADDAATDARPAPLMTRWAADVDPESPWPEYPRPAMVREDWLNLNGYWEYAIRYTGTEAPEAFDGRILVPYPLESQLSGVGKSLQPDQTLHYRHRFTVPQTWQGMRVLMHFEAVDWQCTLKVNGQEVGSHKGGYDPFSFDITNFLKSGEEQEVILSVQDPSDYASQPRGKQVLSPGSIWYTPSSGIWQTVWLEPVAEAYIESYTAVPDLRNGRLRIDVSSVNAGDSHAVEVLVIRDGGTIAVQTKMSGEQFEFEIPDAIAWSPENPFLYSLLIKLQRGDGVVDSVSGYFGMRDVSLGTSNDGKLRIMLNGKPEFQSGVLDQGFWPDGLYTPPTDEAMKSDIEILKAMGFNMLRKHVKVEPRRFYYWCDVLGIWVWQDMPSGYKSGLSPEEQQRPTADVAGQFRHELERMIGNLYNHPSIIVWVPFNESWGQHDTESVTEYVRSLDASRLVNSASGWVDYGCGDMQDIHNYPEPKVPQQSGERALVLGEFGGLGHSVPGHVWNERNWGYAVPENSDALLAQFREYYEQLWWMAQELGLSAAIYTQVTDVEVEANGLLTYDREVVKLDAEEVRRINEERPDIE
ncbi:beta-galactosidase [bacterium]|nr:beta-galactosidase [bacterium]